MTLSVVALDAMGVIYTSADDVSDLLIPFLRERGCALSDVEIQDVYLQGSLGAFTSVDFWRRCGITATDEEYCEQHELTPGFLELVDDLIGSGHRVVALTNDVSEWSEILRRRFGLCDRISDWVVSGDIGYRKPDQAAYAALQRVIGPTTLPVHFFDDRPRNVEAASAAGMEGHVFTSVDQVRQLLLGGGA
jgi:putative hydrolase of the HAD superfamily